MTLRTTIPTLEIKTSGTDLALVDTLYVTIKQGDFQTFKSNDDIEVDNEMISVSLSQSEAAQLTGEGGANVSIMAVGYDSNISNVRIAWVKRGSRTDYGGGGGGSGGGGTSESNAAWYPILSEDGDLSWYKTDTEAPPEPVNIKGETGANGEDGFSPTITENTNNTVDVYKLDITTKTQTFTTPNLKGQNGSGGGGSPSIFAFEIKNDGHLYLITEDAAVGENFYINVDGHLIYRLEG